MPVSYYETQWYGYPWASWLGSLVWLGIGLVFLLLFLRSFQRFLGVGGGRAFLLLLLAFVLACAFPIYPMTIYLGLPWGSGVGWEPFHGGWPHLHWREAWFADGIHRIETWGMRGPFHDFVSLGTTILFVVLAMSLWAGAVAFGYRLYQKWIGGKLTDEEKRTGMEGVRAWLSGGNLIVALAAGLLLSLFMPGISLLSALLLALLALMFYPLLNTLFQSMENRWMPDAQAEISEERNRVLKMLEEGKISAEESTDLLNALGQTHSMSFSSSVRDPLGMRFLFIGGALLLIGFFLPWIGRATGSQVAGGMGWVILLFGMGAAIVHLDRNMQRSAQRVYSLVTLACGGIIMLFVFLQSPVSVGIGFVLAAAGYGLETMGIIKVHQVRPREPSSELKASE